MLSFRIVVLPAASASETPARSTSRSRSEEHTSELQSQSNLVCRLLLEKKKIQELTPQPLAIKLVEPIHPCPGLAPVVASSARSAIEAPLYYDSHVHAHSTTVRVLYISP